MSPCQFHISQREGTVFSGSYVKSVISNVAHNCSTMFHNYIILIILIMSLNSFASKFTPIVSLLLGVSTGFYYRDELFLPTNMRLKVAVLEYHMLTRQKINMDLLDVLDSSSAKRINQKGKEVQEKYEKEINE